MVNTRDGSFLIVVARQKETSAIVHQSQGHQGNAHAVYRCVLQYYSIEQPIPGIIILDPFSSRCTVVISESVVIFLLTESVILKLSVSSGFSKVVVDGDFAIVVVLVPETSAFYKQQK